MNEEEQQELLELKAMSDRNHEQRNLIKREMEAIRRHRRRGGKE